jgi:RNA-binding protein
VYLLGNIKGLGYDGKLIVKGKFAPKINSDVMDNRRKVIGKISRVFGPIETPYISIRPAKNQNPSFDIIGNPVYINKNKRV